MTSSRDVPFGLVTASPWRLVDPRASVSEPWRFRPLVVLRAGLLLMLIAQLGRIPVISTGTSEAPILVNDLVVLAVLAAGALAGLASRQFRVDDVGGLALLFAAVGGFSAVLAIPRIGLTPWETIISLAYLARWLVYFGIYLVVINTVRSDDVMPLWHTLEAMMLLFAAFGLVQSAFLPHFAQRVYPDARVFIDWDEQGHRLVSTILDPNLAGGMIMLVLLVQLAQLATGVKVTLWKPVLLFAALLATLSRGSFVGLFVGGIVIVAVRGVSRRLAQAAGAIVLLIIVAMPKILQYAIMYNKLSLDASALSRVVGWLRGIRIFLDYPLIGVGFNTYGFVQERYGYTRAGASSFSIEGGLLFVAVMTGIVGLALYLGMLTVIVRRCRAIWRDALAPVEWKGLAIGVASATIAMVAHSLFANSLFTVFIMEPLWVVWGIVFVIARALDRPPPRSSVPHLVACAPPVRPVVPLFPR